MFCCCCSVLFFFSFLFHFSMKFILANRIAPDGTPRFAASHLGIFCLPMFHKKEARFIWVNESKCHSVQRFGVMETRNHF